MPARSRALTARITSPHVSPGDMLDAEAEADAQVGGYNSDTEQNAVALGSGGEDDNE